MPTPTNRSSWSYKGSPIVDATPIGDFLRFHTAFDGNMAVARRCGFDEAALRRLMKPGATASIDRLDRIACAMDRPDLISVHYGDTPPVKPF